MSSVLEYIAQHRREESAVSVDNSKDSDQKSQYGSFNSAAVDWKVIDTQELHNLWVTNLPWTTSDTCASPVAHANEFAYFSRLCIFVTDKRVCSGLFDVTILRDSSPICCDFCCGPSLDYLLALEDGSVLQHCEAYKCQSVRLFPGSSDKPCCIGVDGERVPTAPIELRSFPSLLTVVSK